MKKRLDRSMSGTVMSIVCQLHQVVKHQILIQRIPDRCNWHEGMIGHVYARYSHVNASRSLNEAQHAHIVLHLYST